VQALQRAVAARGPALTLTAEDLPAGYTETIMPMDNEAEEARLLVRNGAGPGPRVILSGTERLDEPSDAASFAAHAESQLEQLTRFLRREGLELSAWEELDPAGIGEQALMYRFLYVATGSTFNGFGAVLVFSRGTAVSTMLLLDDGAGFTLDLRRYARIVDARLGQVPLAQAS
jgi:hypothetical protein